jgi:hypothetical protein
MAQSTLRDLLEALKIAASKDNAFVSTSSVIYIFDMPEDYLTPVERETMALCGWLYGDNGNWSYDS